MKNIIRFILFAIFIIFLMIFASKSIDFSKVFIILSNFPLEEVFILCLMSVSISIIKAYRFNILLKNNKIQSSFWSTIKVYIAGQATSPLPGGEAMRGYLINKELGVDVDKTPAPVITQAFMELLSNALIVIVESFIFQKFRSSSIVILGILIILILIISQKKFVKFITSKINTNKFFDRIINKITIAQEGIKSNLFKKGTFYPSAVFFKTTTLAIFANVLGGFIIFQTAKTLNIDLNIIQSIFIYSATVVIGSFTAVIPGGLGFIEGGMASVLFFFKVQTNRAFALIIIFRLITLLFYMLIGIIFLLLFYSKDILIKNGKQKNK